MSEMAIVVRIMVKIEMSRCFIPSMNAEINMNA